VRCQPRYFVSIKYRFREVLAKILAGIIFVTFFAKR